MADSDRSVDNIYPYQPSTIVPIVFAALVGVSLVGHVAQNSRYHFWRITFFLIYANVMWLVGWILRAVSTRDASNVDLYIAETFFLYATPPVYAAAEYNVLGRLLHYLPMHASINPNMVKYFFIYLGALVEGLTAAGAARMATSEPGSKPFQSAGTLLAVATVLQAVVELGFVSLVAVVHIRAQRSGMLKRNVKIVCFTLYGCSTLIVIRCVFRGIEAFNMYGDDCIHCGAITRQEWYLFALEAAPMILYTFWFNLLHPGRFLPKNTKRYLDVDGKTERMGPGWIDTRPWILKFCDPFNVARVKEAGGENTKFWLTPGKWQACQDGTFVQGTASNRVKAKEVGYSKV